MATVWYRISGHPDFPQADQPMVFAVSLPQAAAVQVAENVMQEFKFLHGETFPITAWVEP